jgi:hypothetical protein
MPESTSFIQQVIDRLRREAVVLLPLVYAVIALVPEHTSITDWRVWGPVALGVLLRQVFTSPTHEVEDKEADAFHLGTQFGKTLATTDPKLLKALRALDATDDRPVYGPPVPPGFTEDGPI